MPSKTTRRASRKAPASPVQQQPCRKQNWFFEREGIDIPTWSKLVSKIFTGNGEVDETKFVYATLSYTWHKKNSTQWHLGIKGYVMLQDHLRCNRKDFIKTYLEIPVTAYEQEDEVYGTKEKLLKPGMIRLLVWSNAEKVFEGGTIRLRGPKSTPEKSSEDESSKEEEVHQVPVSIPESVPHSVFAIPHIAATSVSRLAIANTETVPHSVFAIPAAPASSLSQVATSRLRKRDPQPRAVPTITPCFASSEEEPKEHVPSPPLSKKVRLSEHQHNTEWLSLPGDSGREPVQPLRNDDERNNMLEGEMKSQMNSFMEKAFLEFMQLKRAEITASLPPATASSPPATTSSPVEQAPSAEENKKNNDDEDAEQKMPSHK